MATEIERKFLVDVSRLPTLPSGQHIVQGYIPTADKTAVRIRLKGQHAWLTIKGANTGMSRLEIAIDLQIVAQGSLCPRAKGDQIGTPWIFVRSADRYPQAETANSAGSGYL